ncbi:MAG: hypothetical protein R3Y15_01390 [Rikenellaceae bacterium]
MNILITTGHPAQVHNFRELKKELELRGHIIYWLATDKDISKYLLNYYQIEYTLIKRPPKGIFSKIFNLVNNSIAAIKFIKKNKIDFVVSRIHPAIVLGAFLTRTRQIGLADTEISGIYDTIFSKLLGATLTGRSFERTLTKHQIRYNGNIELCYLHPNRFVAREHGHSIVGVDSGTPYVIIRFVGWDAYHDKGCNGISSEGKLRTVQEFSKYAKVFISSERELPEEFRKYQIKIPFEKMHDALKDAALFYGESSTMASESAMLGTPAFYIDNSYRGYTNEEKKAGLVWTFNADAKSQVDSIEYAVQILKDLSPKDKLREKRDLFLKDKIDVTAFLVWFIENYPESKRIMKENPDYQYRFK